MRYAAIALATFGAIMLYLLAVATGNASKLAEYYWWVFGLNSLLLVGLLGVVGRQLLRLRQRVKGRVFGAKLTQRLVMMFAVVALVPGLLVFTISAQFLTRSIESWFDVRVESALDRGLELGKGALNYVLDDVARKSRVVLDDIDGLPGIRTIGQVHGVVSVAPKLERRHGDRCATLNADARWFQVVLGRATLPGCIVGDTVPERVTAVDPDH